MTGWQTIWALLALGICGLIILVILLQRGRGGGLAGAFGGGGSSSAFGAKTGDVFTIVTVVLATVFLVWFVVGNYAFIPGGRVVPTSPAVSDTGTAADDSLPLPAAGVEVAIDDSGDSPSTEVGEPDDSAVESQAGVDNNVDPAADASPPAGDAGAGQP
ncbi:MAG: preprotein translocase subunit SecG [Proteobacteria bacterium]|nr:preprotein translocase subunit SecG [Pseudomonadota bacterium]